MLSPIFNSELKRLELLKFKLQPVEKKIQIAVHRNHSFEVIESVLNVFLNYSGIEASIQYSDYDDSFNFLPINSDLNIIWIDTTRYKIKDISDFFNERVAFLRSQSTAPILVAYIGEQELHHSNISDSIFWNIEPDIASLGFSVYDEAKEKYSGTRLSNKAMLECARILGLKYIPALIKPSLKAIVCDLDNTLYQGVLGEDGAEALIANNELQQKIKTLKDKGFFICIASKNDEVDVREMFAKRSDFILQMEDFTAVQINWNSKGDNIIKLSQTLNISPSAMLFIDDNPAELENVSPTGVHKLLANKDTIRILNYYPGLFKYNTSVEDKLRSKDIQANAERLKLQQALAPAEYFKKLAIKLKYSINNEKQVTRIAELLNKTNQFILNYKRYNETLVNSFMNALDKCVITIEMSDCLSDSGVIAILVAHKEEKTLIIDELTVSCRALGRNLENVMLPELFRQAANHLHTEGRIIIPYKRGDRNAPALTWLANLINTELSDVGTVFYDIPLYIDLAGIEIEVI